MCLAKKLLALLISRQNMAADLQYVRMSELFRLQLNNESESIRNE